MARSFENIESSDLRAMFLRLSFADDIGVAAVQERCPGFGGRGLGSVVGGRLSVIGSQLSEIGRRSRDRISERRSPTTDNRQPIPGNLPILPRAPSPKA